MKIKERKKYFEVNNELGDYKLMKKMSSPMTQNELAEIYEKGKSKGKPIPMNSIQHIELFEDAVKSGFNELINFFGENLQNNPITLTRVIYNSCKKDEVIHNYGTSDAYTLVGDIVGEDGYIERLSNKEVLKSLLGTKDISKLDKIFNGIYPASKMFLRRVNAKFDDASFESVINFWGVNKYYPFVLDAWSHLSLPSRKGIAFLVERLNSK